MSSLEPDIFDVSESIEDLESTITDLCDAISLNHIFSNSATEELLSDLNAACP